MTGCVFPGRLFSSLRGAAGPLAVAIAVGAWLGAAGCDDPGSGHHDDDASVGLLCAVTMPAVCPDSPPRYADVAPIFDQRCNSCHVAGDDGGPWPLDDYDNIVAWSTLIRNDLASCSMPPVDGGVAMTDDERTKILTWALCDYPE